MSWRSARLGRLFPVRPHDQGTEQGRADERHRRIALSAVASALSKVIALATVLVTVPLTLDYLGAERFGIWMMISSLVAILAFADFGIGNGLLNTVAAAHGRNDQPAMRAYISSAYLALSAIALGLLLVFALAYAHVPWHRVFNVSSTTAIREAGPAVAVFVACFLLAIPIGLVQRVQIALQLSFTASLWQCLASALGLIGVVLAVHQQAGLPWLVLALFGAPLLVSLANSLHFYRRTRPELAPTPRCLKWSATRTLLRLGGLFVVLQVVAALAYASDSFVIAHLLGADRVAEYAVPERLFASVSMVLAFALTPLWPAYGEAIARGDAAWVKQTLRRSIKLAVGVSALLSMLLVVIGPALLAVWVADHPKTSTSLLVALAVWKTIEVGATSLAVFLNGANVIRLQLLIATSTLGAALALKFFLVPWTGVEGVVWATAIAYCVCAMIPYFFLLPAIVRRVTGRA